MIASVHLADVGARSALTMSRKTPAPGFIPGLRRAETAIAAPLGPRMLPVPQFGRAALYALWDDDASLDRFLSAHPLAQQYASGWHVRLRPLRAFGAWPGVPADITSARSVDHEGPVAVITMGRLRTSQAVRFLRASAKASEAAVAAPGLLWATGVANPPSFVSTFSLWESSRASSTYAFGTKEAAHPDAIAGGEEEPFHHQQIFIRFAPYDAHGALEGKNPLTFSPRPPSNRRE
jgi:hypothetical protein